MKNTLIIFLLLWIYSSATGQNKEEAEKVVDEGIKIHDKGDYKGAIAKYDEALQFDKNNLFAMAEKAMSLNSLKLFEESFELCKKVISLYPKHDDLQTVYVTYGNAADGLGMPEKSIKIYNEGLKQFPDFYQLHFNKGITLAGTKEYEQAMLCFQNAVMLNPKHASSHNAIARLSNMDNKRIPALLAFCRFFAIEAQSERAETNLASLRKIVKGNVEKTGENSLTISISSESLEKNSTKKGKKSANNFQTADLILSMSAALDLDDENKQKTEVQQFIRKFTSLCSVLDETKKENYGFFWEYYVPYFVEMNEKNHIETFAHIAFLSSDESDTMAWIKTHKEDVDAFFDWSKAYRWTKK